MSTTKKVALKEGGTVPVIPVKKRVRKVAPKSVAVTPRIAKKTIAEPVIPKPVFSETEKKKLSNAGLQTPPLFSQFSGWSVSQRGAATIGRASRIVGATIACVGIIYSVFSLQMSPQFSQRAELIGVATTTDSALDCSLYEQFLNHDCQAQVNTKPPAVLIEPGQSAVSGTIPFKVSAPHASQVKLQLRDTASSFISEPVTMLKTDVQDEWSITIDTKKFANAKFVPKFTVKNIYTLYESFDTKHLVTVFNPVDTPAEVATTTTTTDVMDPIAAITNEDVLSAATVNISVASQQTTGDFTFYIKTPLVDTVTLTALHIGSGKVYTIGNAVRDSDTTWSRFWQSKDAPIGYYRIRTVVTRGAQTYTTDATKVQKITSAASTTDVVVPEETAPVLRPAVSLSISAVSPFSNKVPVRIDVENASSVDFYITPKASLTRSVLGTGTRYSSSVWMFNFDTTQFPDGEYTITTKIKNSYGSYEYVKTGIILRNKVDIIVTPEQAVKIAAIKEVAKEIIETAPATVPEAKVTTVTSSTPIQPLVTMANFGFPETTRRDLRAELDRLGVALRLGDEVQIAEIKARIEAFASHAGTGTSSNPVNIKTLLADVVTQTKEETKKVDDLMSKRTNERAAEDSDHDSVSNYDEIAIYKTSPYSPDTDNDGFLDGIEILSGYDPLNAKPEALVRYESPQDTGVVREDLLAITSISTAPLLTVDATTTEVEIPTALISGKGLANSFITLYIFSTPIIVTLKTDADGSWSYRFDKELEDGKHEMYVGVTDNAGKIIAKSNSFSFVKEAEAFTGTDIPSPVLAQSDSAGDMTSDYTVYLVLGVSTLAIGLVLMLLGVQLRGRRTMSSENSIAE